MKTSEIGELNAEILQNLGIIAEDENTLARVAKYLRRVVKEMASDPTELTEDEFFARVENAQKQPGKPFSSVENLDQYIRSL